ncbi:carbamoyl phosphate synthase small subunit [Liquorilactobacillus hordei]|uniref:carbamoyl phosphate synthase small subunit n=1 Tax=Liquorilactobacillus hordei TaxID=468911 RepID=UPI00070B88C6|nr:carbamoyl phosphate synthase small subunit [Liquorilactobacillus hordei]MBZ2405313.1 carbamoyl phosphate synthase small subunit [Liquorilactobacillus hordei]QYH52145.1 carbamoyl phosphate synthase small subunit [Liquorilactobacillus hordei DSM 19519]
MKRYLILEDGSIFKGEGFGATITTTGEVVFTTGMTGYQEAVTDQSFANQILVFTNPLIGNYGVNLDDYESIEPGCKGVICHELARTSSNWRQQSSFADFLTQMKIPGITGIDTRALTKKLRSVGTMKGRIIDSTDDFEHAFSQLNATVVNENLVAQVSTSKPYPNPGSKRNVVVIDFGLKHSILRELAKRDCNTIVLPYSATAEDIFKLKPDGVLLSNGPGDPKALPAAIEMIQKVEQKIPLFGICFGHQLLALANGADTFKMKFGHRGFNHPVKEIASGRICFTSQNHGYAVDPDSVNNEVMNITYREINDNTVEGLRHKNYPAFSVQFHPDAAPGPHDAVDIFDDFMHMIDTRKDERNA